MRVPRPRWGGAWLAKLAEVPDDGEFHEVVPDYGPTSAYQVARQLNMASVLPEGRFEFGAQVSEDGERSVLFARRL